MTWIFKNSLAIRSISRLQEKKSRFLSQVVCSRQNQHFSIKGEEKKGTSWTLLNNIWRKQVVHRYLQNNICIFQTSISPWRRPHSASLFWAFFLGMVNIFILQKISSERDRLQHFCTFAVILDKFSAPMSSNFFLWKIWVITNSKCAANITWWVYWMRNRGLLLQIFCTFFIHVPS